jgi:hypothetical protein
MESMAIVWLPGLDSNHEMVIRSELVARYASVREGDPVEVKVIH